MMHNVQKKKKKKNKRREVTYGKWLVQANMHIHDCNKVML